VFSVTSLSSYPLVERRVRDRRGARGELGRLAGGDVERGTAGEPGERGPSGGGERAAAGERVDVGHLVGGRLSGHTRRHAG